MARVEGEMRRKQKILQVGNGVVIREYKISKIRAWNRSSSMERCVGYVPTGRAACDDDNRRRGYSKAQIF